MMERILTTVVEISITISLITAFILIFYSRIKKAYGAGWRCLLWLILSIRLIVPFNMTVPTPPITVRAPHNTIAYRQVINTANEFPLEQEQQTALAQPVLPEREKTVQLMEVVSVVWILGVIAFMSYYLIMYLCYKKQVKRWSRSIQRSEVIDMYNQLCRSLPITKRPEIMKCKKISSPMMFGFLRPVLLLPNENYELPDLELILMHELIHFKRRDNWYKLTLLLANAIHWFNPFVYWIAKLGNEDIELSCDNEVIKNSDIGFRKVYCKTILDTMQEEKLFQGALLTYFHGGKKTMKDRFENIFDMNKKRQGIAALCMMVLVIVGSGFFVACSSNDLQGKAVSELLYENKTAHVEDKRKVTAILDVLPVPEGLKRDSIRMETENQPYSITVQYTKDQGDATAEAYNYWREKNAITMFGLIDDVEKITFSIRKKETEAPRTFVFDRELAEKYMDGDLREFSKDKESLDGFLQKLDGRKLPIGLADRDRESSNVSIAYTDGNLRALLSSKDKENMYGFLQKVDDGKFPMDSMDKEDSVSIYIWRDHEITGDDDMYLTVLKGNDHYIGKDKYADLSIAAKDIDSINETLAGYRTEKYLLYHLMEPMDVNKINRMEEYSALMDKIHVPDNIKYHCSISTVTSFPSKEEDGYYLSK